MYPKHRTVHSSMQKVGQARQKASMDLQGGCRKKRTEGGGKDGPPGKTTETLLACAGLEIRKPRLSRGWH